MAQTSISAKSLREIVFNLKMQLKHKGFNSTKALLRNFYSSDRDENGFLDREEFEELLGTSGIFLSRMDVNYLFRYFDKNKDGRISFLEFYDTLVPPLSPMRQSVIEQAFEIIDSEKVGAVSIGFLFSKFNLANHPEVATGQRSADEVAAKFLDTFDARNRSEDSLISANEFVSYYREISASYPHDDEAFVKMMRAVWGISNGLAHPPDIERLEVMLKDKIAIKGRSSEHKVLMNVFKFIDVDSNGRLTPQEFMNALARIGMHLSPDEVGVFFEKYDTDRNGTIDYFEFCQAIEGKREHVFSTSVAHSLYVK